MNAIKLLPNLLISQISAGEVVERPASALKEVLENSIDANASQIMVQLAQGGIKQIRVADDGAGISGPDLPLALARHATSKIDSLHDLQNVATLGFRGEALASIAAVSRLTLCSRIAGEVHAWRLDAEGGHIPQAEPAGLACGTTVEIQDLYFNTPARRKFLKSEATEFAHCDETFKRLALSRPDIGFTLQHNGTVRRHLRKQNAEARIGAILGGEFSAERRQRRTSAALPSGCCSNNRRAHNRLDVLDEQPRAPVAHAHRPFRPADGASGVDSFEQPRLSRSN